MKFKLNIIFALFFTIFCVNRLQAQEKAFPKKGEGITLFLKRHNRTGISYQKQFIELNKNKLGKGNTLRIGVKYTLPPLQGKEAVASAIKRANYEPLFGKELASYNIPIVTIEREDEYTNSVNTDNYMGGVQATSLLKKCNCDIYIHINVDVPKYIPAYGRIQGFVDTCRDCNLSYELILKDLGNSYQDNQKSIQEIASYLDKAYKGKRKGIFLANDTYANMFLNSLIRSYGSLPEDYQIIGFDNSPISNEAVIPTSTVGQQIDKIAETAMEILVEQINERKKRKPVILTTPVHKVITPVLINRDTTCIVSQL